MRNNARRWTVAIVILLMAVGAGYYVWHASHTTSVSSGSDIKPVVNASALPAPNPGTDDDPNYVPPKTKDAELAPMVNRRLPVAERVRADMTSSMPEVKNKVDIAPVVAVLKDPKDSDDVRNEAANLLRRSKYAGLTDDLIAVLNNPAERERFRGFVVQHLGLQAEGASAEERAKIAEVLMKALLDKQVPVRREALLSLVRMKEPKGRETAARWLAAEGADSDAVRDLAVRIVREENLREQLPVIRKLAGSPDEPTRIAAIVTLSEWGDEPSRPAIQEAAKSSSLRTQRAAAAALKRLDELSQASVNGKTGQP